MAQTKMGRTAPASDWQARKGVLLVLLVAAALALLTCGCVSRGDIVGSALSSGNSPSGAKSAETASNEPPVLQSESAESSQNESKVPENPSTVDASGPEGGKAITLCGTVERKNYTPDDTGMGWGAAVLFLDLPSPVTITYNGMTQAETKEYSRVQFFIAPEYLTDGEYLPYHPEEIRTDYDGYVGKQVAITGKLLDAGTAYYMGGASFVDPVVFALEYA